MSWQQPFTGHDGPFNPESAYGYDQPPSRGEGSPRTTSLQWSSRAVSANPSPRGRHHSRLRPGDSPKASYTHTQDAHPLQIPPARASRSRAQGRLHRDSDLDGDVQDNQWPLPGRPLVPDVSTTQSRRSPRLGPRQRAPPHLSRPSNAQSMHAPRYQARQTSPSPVLYASPRVDHPQPAYERLSQLPHRSQPSVHGVAQWTGYQMRPQCPPHKAQEHFARENGVVSHFHGARLQNLIGPPSSTRRGPPRATSQSVIHSVAEESEKVQENVPTALSESQARASYASSGAIPGYYTEDHDEVRAPDTGDDREGLMIEMPPSRELRADRIDEMRATSPVNRQERDDSPQRNNLIRQASLGRKTKPTLMTVCRSDSASRHVQKTSGFQAEVSVESRSLAEGFAVAAPVSQRDATGDGDGDFSDDVDSDPEYEIASRAWSQQSLLAGGAAALASALSASSFHPPEELSQQQGTLRETCSPDDDNAPSYGADLQDLSPPLSDPAPVPAKAVQRTASRELLSAAVPIDQQRRSRPRSPLAPTAVDPAVQRIVAELTESGTITYEEARVWTTHGNNVAPRASMAAVTTSQRTSGADIEKQLPHDIEMPATSTLEMRSSLTSLPDLIRRATKLAHNLDRGRTASRLGLNWFDGIESPGGESKRRSGASMSDMLSSFPAPGASVGELAGAHRASVMSRWSSSNARHSALPSVSDADDAAEAARNGDPLLRRSGCCLPRRATTFLVLLLIILISTAITVPLVLVYGPTHRSLA